MKIHSPLRFRRALLALLALLLLASGAAQAATPPSGTVSDGAPASWTGGPATPTGAGCGGPANPACDNFRLTIAPPTYSFDVEITLTPQLADDYDLEVYGPDGQALETSANLNGQAEQVVLHNPAAGTYTVAAVPYAAVASYSAGARIVTAAPPPPPPPPSIEVPPAYVNYAAPDGLGTSAGEPSLGVNERTGAVLFVAGTETLKTSFDQCTSPATATWSDHSFLTTSQVTLDPILFTDQALGRTFVSQLLGKASATAFTDNDGTTWTPSQGSGINSGVDHQTIGGGPFPSGGLFQPLTGYPNAVYYCSQDIALASCAVSLDGGLTFGPAVPIYTLADCGGLHGHVKVGPDGTAYVPNKDCNGQQAVVVSTDAGHTWTVRRIPGSAAGDSDPSVAVASDGTVYLGWADGGHHPVVAVSSDQGATWSNLTNVGTTAQGLSADLENIAFPAMVAGDGDRAAFAFLGTPTPGNGAGDDPGFPAEWHLYIAHTYDAGLTWVTVDATPDDPVQRGTICQAGTTCGTTRNLLDFIGATLDKEGRVLVGYADGCVGGCRQPGGANSFTALATIARQSTGKRLYAASDLPALSGPPDTPLLEGTRSGNKVTLTWSTPDDHGQEITAYRVYRRSLIEPYQRLIQLYPTDHSYTDINVKGGVKYWYYVTAVSYHGESRPCSEILPRDVTNEPVVNTCVPPGRQVITDASGDAAVAALDVESLSIAEPSFGDGKEKLVFTLKVKSLDTVLPGNAWMILWNRPQPDATADRSYVVMRATGLGTVAYKYGKISPPNLNQATDLGNADAGTSAPDGTIRITLDAAKADGVHAGQDLSGLEVRSFALHLSGQPASQATAVDFSPTASYTLAGNAGCQNTAPLAANDTAATAQGAPVTLAVLANDRDPDNDPLRVITLSAPAHGTVVATPGGQVTYKPNQGYLGSDTFTYTIDDGKGHTAVGRATVTVR
jgi:hypothetical protein